MTEQKAQKLELMKLELLVAKQELNEAKLNAKAEQLALETTQILNELEGTKK